MRVLTADNLPNQPRALIDEWTTGRLFSHVAQVLSSVSELCAHREPPQSPDGDALYGTQLDDCRRQTANYE